MVSRLPARTTKISVRAWVACLLAAGLVLPAVVHAADGNLLANPAFTLTKNGDPTMGFWVGGAGKEGSADVAKFGAGYRLSAEPGGAVCTLTLQRSNATPQYGAYSKPEAFRDIAPGTLLVAEAWIKGNLVAEKPNARTTTLELDLMTGPGPGDVGQALILTPQMELKNGEIKRTLPQTGAFDWTPIRVVFAWPKNAYSVRLMCLTANATGTVQWKGLRVAKAAASESATLAVKEAFATAEEKAAEALAKYELKQKELKAQLGIPEPEQIYTPKPVLSGPHPRYLFPGTPLAEVKRRLALPAFAADRESLFRQAHEFAAAVPPKPKSMDVEDPLRPYAERIAPMALAAVLTDDPAEKQKLVAAVSAYLKEYASWGPPLKDLPNSQFILNIAAAYDWLYDDLDAPTKTITRQYLIDLARWMRQPQNVSAWQWRRGEEWLANHKWFNYCALAMAASVLWGDTAPPLQPGEQKLWMDEAMQVFWVVRKTFGPDGAPVEGYMYGAYGDYPYFTFATLAEQLTTTRVPFLDLPAIRAKGVHRLHSLLPNGAGSFCYADTEVRATWGAEYYRLTAARFKDAMAQRVADQLEAMQTGGGNLAEYYDSDLPPYAEMMARQRAAHPGLATPAEPLLLEAEEFSVPPSGKIAEKLGARGKALVSGDKSGTRIEKSFTVPADGFYHLLFKYALGGQNSRAILLDGQVPFREAGHVIFADTGGWSTDANQWRVMLLGQDIPGLAQPAALFLAKGPHTLALANDYGGGINFDYLAFVPEGGSAAQFLAGLQDTVPPETPKTAPRRPWRNLFFYDPTIPSASLAEQPLFRDNDDLGLFTARSSWIDATPTWFGLKCGPLAGKEVAEQWGQFLWSGHSQPDSGMVQFYWGSRAVLPGANYEHIKQTSSRCVILVEDMAKDGTPIREKLLGQLGEGQWFLGYKNGWAHPTTLYTQHTSRYHTYLCDPSGVYAIPDRRVEGKDKRFQPVYRRSATYLPQGVVVLADKFETPFPRNVHFRLVTAARDLKLDGKDFVFHIGKTPGRIVDFSSTPAEHLVTQEEIESFPNPGADPRQRNVATFRATDSKQAVFVSVLGMNGAEKGITVQADAKQIVIRGVPGGEITLDWKPELQPLPFRKAEEKPAAAAAPGPTGK